MAKKTILALIILILLAFLALNILGANSVEVYIDGENVSAKTNTLSNIDRESLNLEICDYTFEVMDNTSANITTLKEGINDICSRYGLENVNINIDSSIGENQIPILVEVDGTSMLPTLENGQDVLLNKTHDIQVGDIVVAKSDEYGRIIKRVDEINGNSIHLASDNKNVSYEYINGQLYLVRGISTWVDISDINGVAIYY